MAFLIINTKFIIKITKINSNSLEKVYGFYKLLSGMDVKIRLSSKRLNSGRCQVHFQVRTKTGDSSWYGYTLAEPQDTVSDVVSRIRSRFSQAEDKISLHHKVLYHMNEHYRERDDLMIFREA